jgi:hypothetical protein
MNIPEPTEKDKYRGYQFCPCGDGVHLLEAGFDVDTTMCGQCMREVADIDDFNK